MSRVGQTAEKESWRCRGDRQTARVRKAGGQSDFRIGMLAAHRRFREIKTPAMHIPVKMIKAIRITRIKIPGDASAREASPYSR